MGGKHTYFKRGPKSMHASVVTGKIRLNDSCMSYMDDTKWQMLNVCSGTTEETT